MRRISLSSQVLIGIVLGIATGIFLGESARHFEIIGLGFVRLLQMTVLPYIVISLITGLGRLDFRTAKDLAIRGGLIALGLWIVGLAVVCTVPLAFPDWKSATFFSTSSIEPQKMFDFLELYIPSNPFYALAQTIVPASVLFSIAVGIALIGLKQKERILEDLNVLGEALMKITNFIGRLAPYGVFAIMANAAGTLPMDKLERLQVYAAAHTALSLVLIFLIFPGLVMMFTPIRYKEIINSSKDALLTAFATGSLLIVLPMLAERTKEILQNHLRSEDAGSAVDVLIPASFNFPNLGKLLSLSFIFFAGWFLGAPLGLDQYPILLATGFFTLFGQVVGAIPFLLDLTHLPSDMFELYILVDVITSRFGTMLAAMHTLVLAILGAYAIRRRLRLNVKRMVFFGSVSITVLLLSLFGLRLLFTYLAPDYKGYQKFISMELLVSPTPNKVYRNSVPPSVVSVDANTLERIQKRGRIRVGFLPDALPMVFTNEQGDLVGFDVEMAHQLARDLNVEIDFVQVSREQAIVHLDRGQLDILMTGVAITPQRSRAISFSVSYMDQTLALITEDFRNNEFNTINKLKKHEPFRLAVIEERHYGRMISEFLPQAEIVVIKSPRDFFEKKVENLDSFLFSAEAGSAWSLIYPAYGVALPRPEVVAIPIGYATARNDQTFLNFINHWIQLRKKDGTVKMFYDYWILGRKRPDSEPHWSVIRNVLGWVD